MSIGSFLLLSGALLRDGIHLGLDLEQCMIIWGERGEAVGKDIKLVGLFIRERNTKRLKVECVVTMHNMTPLENGRG